MLHLCTHSCPRVCPRNETITHRKQADEAKCKIQISTMDMAFISKNNKDYTNTSDRYLERHNACFFVCVCLFSAQLPFAPFISVKSLLLLLLISLLPLRHSCIFYNDVQHLCFCTPSQIELRMFAAGCSVFVVDTCAVVRSCTLGTTDFQNQTAKSGRSSLLMQQKLAISIFLMAIMFTCCLCSELDFFFFFSCKDADTELCGCPELHISSQIHSHKDTEQSVFFVLQVCKTQFTSSAASLSDSVTSAWLRSSGYIELCC